MATKDVNGYFWLRFEGDDICSQCKKPINDGDKIFIDGVGVYHKNKGVLEVGEICIYHHDCIIK